MKSQPCLIGVSSTFKVPFNIQLTPTNCLSQHYRPQFIITYTMSADRLYNAFTHFSGLIPFLHSSIFYAQLSDNIAILWWEMKHHFKQVKFGHQLNVWMNSNLILRSNAFYFLVQDMLQQSCTLVLRVEHFQSCWIRRFGELLAANTWKICSPCCSTTSVICQHHLWPWLSALADKNHSAATSPDICGALIRNHSLKVTLNYD